MRASGRSGFSNIAGTAAASAARLFTAAVAAAAASRRLVSGTRPVLLIAVAPILLGTAGADRPQTPPSRPPLRPPPSRPRSHRGSLPRPRPPTARAPPFETSRSRPILRHLWSPSPIPPSSSDSPTPTRPRPPPPGSRSAHQSQRASAMRLRPLNSCQCHEFNFQGECRRT